MYRMLGEKKCWKLLSKIWDVVINAVIGLDSVGWKKNGGAGVYFCGTLRQGEVR